MRTFVLTAGFLVFVLADVGAHANARSAFETDQLPVIEIVDPPADTGIRVEVAEKYKVRFAKWQAELVSTDFGRAQWDRYATNRHFLLVIKVDPDHGMGAGTDKFTWDTNGNFIGATITIGSEIETGFPEPTYYPVLNALAPDTRGPAIRSSVVAAAKISHEIGHVEQTEKANMKLMQLQSKLIPQYMSIFLKNGFDENDKRLLDLEQQIGGTPTSIWEEREYTSEIDTMRYVSQRIDIGDGLCRVLKRIRQNLDNYAGEHGRAFEQAPELSEPRCSI